MDSEIFKLLKNSSNIIIIKKKKGHFYDKKIFVISFFWNKFIWIKF